MATFGWIVLGLFIGAIFTAIVFAVNIDNEKDSQKESSKKIEEKRIDFCLTEIRQIRDALCKLEEDQSTHLMYAYIVNAYDKIAEYPVDGKTLERISEIINCKPPEILFSPVKGYIKTVYWEIREIEEARRKLGL